MNKQEINQAVKKGDLIVLVKSNHGIPKSFEGEIFEVTTTRHIASKTSFQARTINRTNKPVITYMFYYTGPADSFIVLNKKDQRAGKIIALQMKKKILQDDAQAIDANLVELNKQIAHLEKYESEEAFVASKLDKLFQASTTSDKKTRVKVMTKILKELKESHLL